MPVEVPLSLPRAVGTARELRLILGDQLNARHPWFAQPDPDVMYLLAEMRQETDYVVHHVQKVLAFFAAMRLFAKRLIDDGHRVVYLTLDDPANRQTLEEVLRWALQTYQASAWGYQLPDEYRLDQQLHALQRSFGLPCAVADTRHFLTRREDLERFFSGKKTYLMEAFYRHMRRKTGLLMRGQGPEGERWNFDAENRGAWRSGTPVPTPLFFPRDLSAIRDLLETQGVETLGQPPSGAFGWALTRDEALQLLAHFIAHLLPQFGRFQDALTADDPFLFHSRLSFALNVKLIDPLEVCLAVESAWRARPAEISLAQAEGFIRQIIGWREYVRGVYWARMPTFAGENYFTHTRPLPQWYWNGETHMACLRAAIGQSLRYAYAHHIQRLMVTGNFALLAGVAPEAVDAWYLGIYLDAIEWVELPNTRGMSQFADGGLLATKPYAASGAYIQRMGNLCKRCRYDVKSATGARACPFNSLYWHFMQRHRALLAQNPRIGMAYRTWDRFDPARREALIRQAEANLAQIDTL
ncbi:MAG: cryptochrome/photolyase family protein [Thiotrichales bacterium]